MESKFSRGTTERWRTRRALSKTLPDSLKVLAKEVVACGRCPRLREYREHVAEAKRRAYRDWT